MVFKHLKYPYDMGWWFGGSVGIEPFWWIILDKNNIHSFHLCMISGNQDDAWPMYHVWPISERFYAWVIRWHVTGMLSLAEHWHSRRALSNHVCAHSVIVMWHVIFLQHLARACSEQCISGFVNPDYLKLGIYIQRVARHVEFELHHNWVTLT